MEDIKTKLFNHATEVVKLDPKDEICRLYNYINKTKIYPYDVDAIYEEYIDKDNKDSRMFNSIYLTAYANKTMCEDILKLLEENKALDKELKHMAMNEI